MNPELSTIVVHDLKNALGVLESELRELAEAPERAAAIHAHATCVALRERLIGFLTLYKASTQGLQARIDYVSPEDFLRGVLAGHACAPAGVSIELDTAAAPAIGFFDENLVGLALEAALQNAGRFARSRIELGCRAESGELVFSVRDDGPGLETQEEKPSTGLGMELCRAIAQAHAKGDNRGSAKLFNRPEGGAAFELRLP